MDATEFFPSRWLKAEDVGEKSVFVTINRASMEDIVEDKKPVLWFDEFEKGLVLNATNNQTLIDLFGKETDSWNGQKVELYTVLVSYKKKEVPAIRIRALP